MTPAEERNPESTSYGIDRMNIDIQPHKRTPKTSEAKKLLTLAVYLCVGATGGASMVVFMTWVFIEHEILIRFGEGSAWRPIIGFLMVSFAFAPIIMLSQYLGGEPLAKVVWLVAINLQHSVLTADA